MKTILILTVALLPAIALLYFNSINLITTMSIDLLAKKKIIVQIERDKG